MVLISCPARSGTISHMKIKRKGFLFQTLILPPSGRQIACYKASRFNEGLKKVYSESYAAGFTALGFHVPKDTFVKRREA